MANAQTTVEHLQFIIKEDLTYCNLFYTSSEPDNPFWGGGWKNKSFPKSKPVADFINEEVVNFLEWNSGRSHDLF